MKPKTILIVAISALSLTTGMANAELKRGASVFIKEGEALPRGTLTIHCKEGILSGPSLGAISNSSAAQVCLNAGLGAHIKTEYTEIAKPKPAGGATLSTGAVKIQPRVSN